jgi:hypothetical protein
MSTGSARTDFLENEKKGMDVPIVSMEQEFNGNCDYWTTLDTVSLGYNIHIYKLPTLGEQCLYGGSTIALP